MNPIWDILQGDSTEVMRGMEPESVHCVVTSPPYWGLRNYGVDGAYGLEPTLEEYIANMVEVFREVRRVLRKDGSLWLNLGDAYWGSWGNYGGQGGPNGQRHKETERFDRPAYADNGRRPPQSYSNSSLKPKDLIGLPWRVAFALQADGWWLRSDIVWHKPNTMPESVRDRPTRAHEYVFLLTKSARYYYDADAIREPAKDPLDDIRRMRQQHDANKSAATAERNGLRARTDKQRGHSRTHAGFNDRWDAMSKAEQQAMGANKRTVWSIATQPYSGAHFATFPEKLVEPCILAGTSERGVCGVTGDPWERVVEVTPEYQAVLDSGKAWRTNAGKPDGLTNRQNKDHPSTLPPKHTTTGWRPTCGAPWERVVMVEDPGRRLGKGYHDHGDDIGRGQRGVFSANGRPTRTTTGWQPTCEHDSEPVASVVLDPFCGSGTTGVVALRHGRSFVGIELNPEYIALARKRIIDDAPLLNTVPEVSS